MRDGQQPQPGDILLLSLANELLDIIIAQIESHKDLCNLAATCSRLKDLTEPFIWQSLLVLHGAHVTWIGQALRRDWRRASFVHELAIRYGEEHEEGIEGLDTYIRHMKQLRHLTIESPCPNNNGGWIGGASLFPSWTRVDYATLFEEAVDEVKSLEPPPLSMLQSGKMPCSLLRGLKITFSVTLHGHRSRDEPFIFGRTAAIFFHPTLRNLTISCTNFDAQIELADIPPGKLNSTPLQSLTFIECNVYMSLLDVVLSLPKALKELSVGERLHAWEGCYPDPIRARTTDPSFVDALQKQKHSLERLAHNYGSQQWRSMSPFARRDPETSSKVQNLRCLKHLELSLGMHAGNFETPGSYPDSLRTLKITDAPLAVVLGLIHQSPSWPIIFMISAAHRLVIKNTQKSLDLDICFTYTGYARPLPRFIAFWGGHGKTNQEYRMKIYEIATVMKARGSRLRIFGEDFEDRGSFIPPYMYGEPTPREVKVYDSDNLWTFCGIDYQRFDAEDLPKNYRAVCLQCRESKGRCANLGYGSTCVVCEVADRKCEYPPPASPWTVNSEWLKEHDMKYLR